MYIFLFFFFRITLSGEEQCANGNKGQRCPQIIALFQSVRSINGDLFFFAARPNRDDVVDIHICFGIVRFLAQLASLFIFIIALSFTWHGS